MMNHRGLAFLAVLAVVAAWAQSPGAKSIFYDTVKNQPVRPNETKVPSRAPGLRVAVDLVGNNGAATPVNFANREFRSGDRVRLRLMSNIAGRLLLILVAEDGTSKMLFPDPRINNGDSSVAAMKETVVPGAAGATIQFDQQPGMERLLALVSSDDGFNQLGIDWQKRTFDADETRSLYQKLSHTTGSKGLTVEVDDQSPATYTVADCPVPPGAAKGMDLITTGCADSSGAATPPKVYSEIRLLHKQ